MSQLNLQNRNLTTFPDNNNADTITQLILANNQISTIPPQIRNYTLLQYLDLSNNRIKILSKEIFELFGLTQLNLPNNQIEKISIEVSKLQRLQLLSISSNKLTYLPQEIGDLSNLTNLQVTNNNLEEIPESIGKLSKLTHLYLQNNKLEDLPDSLGNLQNLQHLFLDNNNLVRLPRSLKKLKNLKRIYLTGNQLPLLANHQNIAAQKVIEYVLDNQPPPKLNTNKIFIYRHISSIKEIEEEYYQKLNEFLEQQEIKYVEIESLEDLEQPLTVVFFLVPFDIVEKPIFELVEKCIEKEQRFYILMQHREYVNGTLINLEKGKEIKELHTKLQKKYESDIIFYKDLENLTNYIFDALENHIPKVIFKSLLLKNIGHFSELNLSFDEDITCLIGENGSGKTTILRALALAVIGIKTSKIEQRKIEKLLRIKGFDEKNQIIFQEEGEIKLSYTIDGDERENIINLNYHNGEIELSDSGDFDILANRYELKSLILGFAQIREYNQNKDYISTSTRPKIDDLLPLVNNIDDQRLESFSKWIVNLSGEGNRKMNELEIKNKNEIEEFVLLEKTFEIISKLSKHKIEFLRVMSFSPPEILVKTYDNQEAIPLNMISQGFKVLISWIGHFLQRLIEAYPLNKESFTEEKSIILIDEIDSYIHPKWQLDLLESLQEIFPNTQFIVSTHSPLVILNHKPEEVIELKEEENTVNINEKEKNKLTTIDATLLSYFGIERVVSKEVQEKINEYNSEVLANGKTEKAKKLETELKAMYVAAPPLTDKYYLKFLQLMKEKGLLIPEKIEEAEIEKWEFDADEWKEFEKSLEK